MNIQIRKRLIEPGTLDEHLSRGRLVVLRTVENDWAFSTVKNLRWPVAWAKRFGYYGMARTNKYGGEALVTLAGNGVVCYVPFDSYALAVRFLNRRSFAHLKEA